MKQLGLQTTAHPQSYTIRWLHQGRDLCVSKQCCLPYIIKLFTDEVLCDVAPLEILDVLLGQPYLWKRHAVYESRPRSVIITLANKLYKIPEVAPPTAISLITAKQCSKIISQTRKFVFLMIRPQGKKKVVATASRQGSSAQQNQMDKIVEEYRDIFASPTGIPLHCQVKHSIDLTPGTPLPNGPIYRCSALENDEIKRQIQELLQKGHIRPSSSSCGGPIVLVQKKDGTWKLYIDYWALNKITVWYRYPIPWIDDLLDQLQGTKYFARLTWNQVITRCLSNPLMCGRLPSNPRRAFLNGWSCRSGWDCNLHETDGRHLVALHQCIRGGVFRWHLDLQLELGRAPPPSSTGPSNPSTTQVVR